MTRRTEQAAERDRVAAERREAYFAALRVARLELRIAKCQRLDKPAKLASLARRPATRWLVAADAANEAGTAAAYEACLAPARVELRFWAQNS